MVFGVCAAGGLARVAFFCARVWADGKTLRDAPLVGHRGFVVIELFFFRQVFLHAFFVRAAGFVAA